MKPANVSKLFLISTAVLLSACDTDSNNKTVDNSESQVTETANTSTENPTESNTTNKDTVSEQSQNQSVSNQTSMETSSSQKNQQTQPQETQTQQTSTTEVTNTQTTTTQQSINPVTTSPQTGSQQTDSEQTTIQTSQQNQTVTNSEATSNTQTNTSSTQQTSTQTTSTSQPTVEQNTQPTSNNQSTAWLEAHNKYRRMHQVGDLVWSDTVAKQAQAFADTCPTGHSKSNYGENLAFSTAKQTPEGVVQRWYDEVSEYDFANPKYSAATGHFTQVVWKGTTEIGCAQATCAGRWADIAVCQYNKPGNYLNQFAANVLPKKP